MRQQRVSKFWHDERGGLALAFGLALPVLLLGAGAMMEYASLTSRRAQLQQAADTGALTAARELSLANADDTRVVSVAKSAALSSLAGGQHEGSAATVGASVMDKRSGVQVVVNETVVNLMGKVMSLPSSELEARATAKLSGGGRLCVLTLDPNAGAAIRLDTASKLTANGCSVQSNSTDKKSIQVRDSGFLLAERICSSGGYEGRVGANVSPTPLTDCPPIKDPLASRPPPPVPASCDNGSLVPLLPRKINGGNRTLDPGTYCGGLIVTNGANVTLREGTYIFNQGPLVVDKGSTLAGDYVGFYFNGDLATMKFDFDSIINLSAPKTGTMAGLLDLQRSEGDPRQQVQDLQRQRAPPPRHDLPAAGRPLRRRQQADRRPVRLHRHRRPHDRAPIRPEPRAQRQLRRDRRSGAAGRRADRLERRALAIAASRPPP